MERVVGTHHAAQPLESSMDGLGGYGCLDPASAVDTHSIVRRCFVQRNASPTYTDTTINSGEGVHFASSFDVIITMLTLRLDS